MGKVGRVRENNNIDNNICWKLDFLEPCLLKVLETQTMSLGKNATEVELDESLLNIVVTWVVNINPPFICWMEEPSIRLGVRVDSRTIHIPWCWQRLIVYSSCLIRGWMKRKNCPWRAPKNTTWQRKFNITVKTQRKEFLFLMTWKRLEKSSKFRTPKNAG